MTARAYLLSSLGGRVVSPGVALIGQGLTRLGIKTEFHGWRDWQGLIPKVKAKPEGDTLMLLGYSQGAMRAIQLAKNIQPTVVDLLVTLVPATNWMVPTNVRYTVNHTVNNGIFWSGPLKAEDPEQQGTITNINHFSIFGITHVTIQGMPSVHNNIIRAAQEIML